MWRFYWVLVCGIPKALYNVADLTLSASAVVAFFLTLLNRRLGERLVMSWHAISPWWALLPMGLLFIYGLMRSNYEHYCQLESGFKDRLAKQEQQCLTLQQENIRLNLEANDLKQPKRTPYQEKEYQAIKPAVDAYDENHKIILRHLLRCGKITKHMQGRLTPLPAGFSESLAADVLSRLASDHLITSDTRTSPGGWEIIWQIAPGAKSILEELL